MLGGQRVDIGIPENVESLGIGLHQAIFDAVVNHLDEVPGADRAGMNIALLDARIASLAAAGALDIADARRQACEDRIEAIDHRLVAADHYAIAARDAPHAARRADVDIVDATLFQHFAAADV